MNSVLLQWGTSNVLWDSHDQCQTKIILVRGNLFVHTHTQFMNPMNLVISASATDCTSLCSSVSGNSRQVINLKKLNEEHGTSCQRNQEIHTTWFHVHSCGEWRESTSAVYQKALMHWQRKKFPSNTVKTLHIPPSLSLTYSSLPLKDGCN